MNLRRRLFWDAYAIGYDVAWDSPVTSAVSSEISLLGPFDTVVDLGCGTGLLSEHLARPGTAVTGVDSSERMLQRALGKNRISYGVQGEVAKTPLASSSFDCVVCANVLHLHPDPDLVIQEASRLVRSGGLVAWVTPTAGLDQAGAVAGDRASGRSAIASFAALTVRSLITPFALMTGVRVRPAGQVLEKLAQTGQYGLITATQRTFFDSQTLILMRKAGEDN